MVLDIIGVMLESLPSRKTITINKKLKMLKKIDWYQALLNKHGILLTYNDKFRDYIYEVEVKAYLFDADKQLVLQEHIHQIIKEERL